VRKGLRAFKVSQVLMERLGHKVRKVYKESQAHKDLKGFKG
jgi:hypothetical protein